jgi:hypothetical protein
MNTNYIASCPSIAASCGRRVLAFCLSLCTLGMAVAASAGQPRFITFDAPGAGTGPYQGTGCAFSDCYVLLNDWGEITGYYLDANNVYHGFVRSPEGNFTSFDAPGADTTPQSFNGTIPNGINDAGAITGYYIDSSGNDHGFLRSADGAFTTFNVPEGIVGTTAPIALNLESAIVGYYLDQKGVFQGFLRRPDGTFATWAGPGACDATAETGCYGTGALGINVFRTISGHYEDNRGNFVAHGLVRSPEGTLTAFDAPGAGTGPYQGTGCPGCAIPINLFGAVAGY